MLHKPRDCDPVQAALLLRKAGPQKEEGKSCREQSAGGGVAVGKKQEESTAWFFSCMERVGGGHLVVNGNRWASSQEKRWKNKTKTVFGRMLGMKAGKLREGVGNILPLGMKDLSLIQKV